MMVDGTRVAKVKPYKFIWMLTHFFIQEHVSSVCYVQEGTIWDTGNKTEKKMMSNLTEFEEETW